MSASGFSQCSRCVRARTIRPKDGSRGRGSRAASARSKLLAQEVGIEIALSAAARPRSTRRSSAAQRGRYAGRSARSIASGAEGLVNAGHRDPGAHDLAYGLGHAVMGGEWFHGGTDRSNALAQLGIDWHAFTNDLHGPTVSATDATWIAADDAAGDRRVDEVRPTDGGVPGRVVRDRVERVRIVEQSPAPAPRARAGPRTSS